METLLVLAAITGSPTKALACLGAALGVGLVGMKAVEAVGRNPGAFGKILVIGKLSLSTGCSLPPNKRIATKRRRGNANTFPFPRSAEHFFFFGKIF